MSRTNSCATTAEDELKDFLYDWSVHGKPLAHQQRRKKPPAVVTVKFGPQLKAAPLDESDTTEAAFGNRGGVPAIAQVSNTAMLSKLPKC
jgi:hypothetical protein